MRASLRVLLAVFAVFALFVAACGDDDDEGSEESTETTDDSGESSDSAGDSGESTPGLDPEFVEQFQTQLSEVGCYSGAIDGIDGPATTAAIVNFQRAQGLGEDGVVGPETEGALQDAVEAGVQVCFPEGDGTEESDDEGAMDGAEDGPTVSVDSASYGKEFVVQSCENPGETTLALTAEANDIVLEVDATDGEGTVFISGGNEQDGVDLAGTVTSVMVGDAGNLTVEGTWDADTGGDFTITGSCAGA